MSYQEVDCHLATNYLNALFARFAFLFDMSDGGQRLRCGWQDCKAHARWWPFPLRSIDVPICDLHRELWYTRECVTEIVVT